MGLFAPQVQHGSGDARMLTATPHRRRQLTGRLEHPVRDVAEILGRAYVPVHTDGDSADELLGEAKFPSQEAVDSAAD